MVELRHLGHLRFFAGRLSLQRATRAAAFLAATSLLVATPAEAQQVRITRLSNANFGTITNLASDTQRNQSVCIYSSVADKGYNVTASGSGSGGAFTLSSGSATMAYEVQWNDVTGQTSGTDLSPGIKLSGLTTTATSQNCGSGPSRTASLIVLLRAATLGSATAGTYSGTLTLLIEPE